MRRVRGSAFVARRICLSARQPMRRARRALEDVEKAFAVRETAAGTVGVLSAVLGQDPCPTPTDRCIPNDRS